MLESLIISLREGIEAALVVGIVWVFLSREGLQRHLRAVWMGLAAATAASVAGAVVLARWAVDEEVFEGLLYLASAVIVSSMMVWMWRHAKDAAREMKGALGRIAARDSERAVFWGIFTFTFLMVFREGVETALFLAAVSLTTSGVLALFGTLAGLGLAVWFAVLFIRGSLRLDLGVFFRVTGVALFIFVGQLLLNGYHELSEARWVPANPTTMAAIGPLVRNETLFVVAVLALPLIALAMRRNEPAPSAANSAQARLVRVQLRRQHRTRLLGTSVGIGIVALLGFGFTYSHRPPEVSPPTLLTFSPADQVRIPVGDLSDDALHRYAVEVGGAQVRFIALRVGEGDYALAFDACVICGPEGYYQDGPEIICLHCGSAIYPPSIGQEGGCNPIPLAFHREGDELVVDRAQLTRGPRATS